MTLEHVHQTDQASWAGILPGKPEPYFLEDGEGEHSQLFDGLCTVLLSADETEGQFGVFTVKQPEGDIIPAHNHDAVHEIFYVRMGAVTVFLEHRDGRQEMRALGPGGFGYTPAGVTHAFRCEACRNVILGVSTGGFERFVQAAGTATDRNDQGGMFVPSPEHFMAAMEQYGNSPRFDTRWTV